MQIARRKAPEFKKPFKQRRENILEGRINALHEKQHALETARRRASSLWYMNIVSGRPKRIHI